MVATNNRPDRDNEPRTRLQSNCRALQSNRATEHCRALQSTAEQVRASQSRTGTRETRVSQRGKEKETKTPSPRKKREGKRQIYFLSEGDCYDVVVYRARKVRPKKQVLHVLGPIFLSDIAPYIASVRTLATIEMIEHRIYVHTYCYILRYSSTQVLKYPGSLVSAGPDLEPHRTLRNPTKPPSLRHHHPPPRLARPNTP